MSIKYLIFLRKKTVDFEKSQESLKHDYIQEVGLIRFFKAKRKEGN